MSAISALPPQSNLLIEAFCRQLHVAQVLEYQFQQEVEFIRAFRDTTPDLLLQLRADGAVLNVNHAPEFTLFPVTAEILQRNIDELLPTEPARTLRTAMDDALREQKPAHCEWVLPVDGQDHQFEVRVAYLRPNQVLAIVRDVTEQRDLLQQMEALSIRLLALQEDERGRIAHDLHDEVGQTLTAALLQLEQVVIRTGEAARLECDQLRTTLQELTRYVRNLALELRPAILDDMGLGQALVSMAQRYQVQTHIHVSVFLWGLDRRFTREVETAAYRIIQEALTNVARYAQVKQAGVKLKVEEQLLHIEIEDRGVGFEVRRMLQEKETQGLRSMRERTLLLHGTFRIESTLDQGTCIIVELPLSLAQSIEGRPV
jgi:PAS domain S-box-containing protein